MIQIDFELGSASLHTSSSSFFSILKLFLPGTRFPVSIWLHQRNERIQIENLVLNCILSVGDYAPGFRERIFQSHFIWNELELRKAEKMMEMKFCIVFFVDTFYRGKIVSTLSFLNILATKTKFIRRKISPFIVGRLLLQRKKK